MSIKIKFLSKIKSFLSLIFRSKKEKVRKINLLESNSIQAYRPLLYPWAYEAWKMQQQMHWLPEEVPMADDINDWKNKLTEEDKSFLTNIFRFFTQADIDVNECYMNHYAKIFKPIEVRMMLSAFSNMETIHVEAYSHLIETLGMPSDIYLDFLNFKAMRDKHSYLEKFNVNTKEDIAATLAMYGAFTEGLQLFSSFALLLNYSRHGLMKGMGQIVTWSFRDETLHTRSIIKLFSDLIDENQSLWTKKLKNKIFKACLNVIKFEDAFIDICFGVQDHKIRNLEKEDVKNYIRYLARIRLSQLGLENDLIKIAKKNTVLHEVEQIKRNPLPWIDEMTNVEFANFFESRVTEYSKTTLSGNWDDAF